MFPNRPSHERTLHSTRLVYGTRLQSTRPVADTAGRERLRIAHSGRKRSKSGQWRTTPVNLLEFGGQRYLVAPRGVTEWVRNLRASREGELRLGSGREPIRVIELGNEEKPELLRHYLRRWKWEVGQFFEGVGPDASDADIRRIAPNHPVFRIV
jgi:deazaflavin-dependent oxidoreductase (nitroreductase family)